MSHLLACRTKDGSHGAHQDLNRLSMQVHHIATRASIPTRLSRLRVTASARPSMRPSSSAPLASSPPFATSLWPPQTLMRPLSIPPIRLRRPPRRAQRQSATHCFRAKPRAQAPARVLSIQPGRRAPRRGRRARWSTTLIPSRSAAQKRRAAKKRLSCCTATRRL